MASNFGIFTGSETSVKIGKVAQSPIFQQDPNDDRNKAALSGGAHCRGDWRALIASFLVAICWLLSLFHKRKKEKQQKHYWIEPNVKCFCAASNVRLFSAGRNRSVDASPLVACITKSRAAGVFYSVLRQPYVGMRHITACVYSHRSRNASQEVQDFERSLST